MKLYVTHQDFDRLSALTTRTAQNDSGSLCARTLRSVVYEAVVVPPDDVPPNVVTMRSVVRVRWVDSGEEMTCTLVYPGEADFQQGRISVLSPLGSGLLGRAVNKQVSYATPSGVRTVEVLQIMYQPEASGDYES